VSIRPYGLTEAQKLRDIPEVKVTTTCPLNIYKEAKEKGVGMRALLIRGWASEENFPALLERQRDQEEKILRLRVELEHTSAELWKLRDNRKQPLRGM